MPYVTVRGSRLFYAESGAGDVILFGHSFLWDGAMWRDQVAMLSKRYRCIVPDLWGHGLSETLRSPKVDIKTLAEDHLALMDALGVTRFSIVGLSVGGMWAAHLAMDHPGRVDKLVLCDTDLGKEPWRTRIKYGLMTASLRLRGGVAPALADKIVPIFFSPHTLRRCPELAEAFRESLLAIDAARIPTIAALSNAIFGRKDVLNALKTITAETHVIVGADDIARPPHEARRLAELIPNATLSIIENAGHIPAREQPEQMNAVLAGIFGGGE